MKKSGFIKSFLFVLLMLLLWLSAIQQWKPIWSFPALNGVLEPTDKAELTFENCCNGSYQRQTESYLKENFGFREPLIRFYNQYLYDFFKLSTNKSIAPGKDHWMYFKQNVNHYYGTEMYRWYESKEKAKEAYDKESKMMWKLRSILKEYGVEFFVFMAPEKGSIYPEHLPKLKFDTATINARKYFADKFDEYGFPYIEMTKWFIDIKEADTMCFPLFPQTGVHWNFSSVYAMDSLLRFMGDLKGMELPKLKIGLLHESNEETLKGDRDCERLANLLRPLPCNNKLYDAEVSVVTGENIMKPNVLFVGTSFLERMYYFIPFDSLFSYSEYWYYNSTVRYGKKYQKVAPAYERDLLQTLLDSDFVVWFAEGEQVCKASFGFVEKALLRLCYSDEFVDAQYWQLTQSLGVSYQEANDLIKNYPEQYFPELGGDSIPTIRNPRIPEALAIKEIKKDPDWIVKLRCQATYLNQPYDDVLKAEAHNLLNHNGLMRDTIKNVTLDAYAESFMDEMVKSIVSKPDVVKWIEEKAAGNNITYEQQLNADALWIIKNNINTGEIYWNEALCEESK